MLNNDFLRYDYRVSHNYYFNEKSADFLFKKLKLKTIFVKTGLQEYDFNHLLEYVKTRKEVKNYKKIYNKRVIDITTQIWRNTKFQQVFFIYYKKINIIMCGIILILSKKENLIKNFVI